MPAGDLIDPAQVERFRADLAALCDVDTGQLLVAVSGGGDSLALLLLAHATLRDRVQAATVDHGMRPAAAAEAAFVAGVCRGLGIPHRTLVGELPDRVGNTANLSARARTLRYRLLDAHRRDSGCDWVATGHHADDQLETLVMRLNRGAGVAGLAGVRAKAEPVVRPLLGWRRAELTALVAAAGLKSVIDPSNTDDRFDRARLRKALADADWLDPLSAVRSAQALAEADEALDWTLDHLLADRCRLGERAAVLDSDRLPAEFQRRLLLRCLRHIDSGIRPRGHEVTGLLATLARSGTGTLGGVKVLAFGGDWHFSPVPPRRTG